jgi:hypothetical protein
MSITSIHPTSARFICIIPLPGADMDYTSGGLLQTSNRNLLQKRLKFLSLFRLNTIGYYSLGQITVGISPRGIYTFQSTKFTLTALVLLCGPYGTPIPPIMISFDCPRLAKSRPQTGWESHSGRIIQVAAWNCLSSRRKEVIL